MRAIISSAVTPANGRRQRQEQEQTDGQRERQTDRQTDRHKMDLRPLAPLAALSVPNLHAAAEPSRAAAASTYSNFETGRLLSSPPMKTAAQIGHLEDQTQQARVGRSSSAAAVSVGGCLKWAGRARASGDYGKGIDPRGPSHVYFISNGTASSLLSLFLKPMETKSFPLHALTTKKHRFIYKSIERQ